MDRSPKAKNDAGSDMAAPEAPLCYVGVAKQSAAFRLMKQMVLLPILSDFCFFFFQRLDWIVWIEIFVYVKGWEEGEGLGKDKQGIKGHVRVKNKQDTNG